ncbi:MAG: hypothetical protein ACREHC_00885, partial [Candidatus Levyibacteriota bacterium]
VIGLPIVLSIVVFDYNRDKSFLTSPDETQMVVASIRNRYPNRPIEVYQCDLDPTAIGPATVYLLKFEEAHFEGKPAKLAVITGICKNPRHKGKSNYTLLQGTSFMDMSQVSESEFNQASWSAVTTEKVFKKSAKWY